MASPAGPSQPNLPVPGPQAADEPQVPRASQAAETNTTAHDHLGELLTPGTTGVYNPKAPFKSKTYCKAAGAEATADMPNTESFRSEGMDIDAGSFRAT